MTYPEYREAVITDILEQINGEPDGEGGVWSRADADWCCGDVSDMHAAGKTAHQAANELLYVASQEY